MKNHFVVIDTNVLVSGLLGRNSSSPTVGILNHLLTSKEVITPLYCEEIFQEYENVLHREKFNFDQDEVEEVLKRIKDIGISSPRILSKISLPDLKDVVFYEVALSKEESFLVTGNIKYFPEVDFVVTPAEMMSIIEKDM
ncbi:MAG: putative toxin-antitoxin system toxin component, PIN family [Bacteroidales bacterium]|nr:putative toxin-antitoxin system toxin component, PIN family [Bacteroidales bacterium]